MNFFKSFFSLTCLTISFLLLFYTFYKAEVYWDGERSNYYLIYYILSGILIIFSIFTFYLKEKTKDYLIIALITIVLSLYFFEAYLILNEKADLNEKVKLYKKETGKKYDTRTKLGVYIDLKKNDSNIVVSIPPASYGNNEIKILPLSGISNSKTVKCNENGYYTIYKSDRYGFNNPDEEWDKQEIEYVLVGDSFAQGSCVNRPNDIASVLRILSEKSVLSFGYGRNGPLTEYATLREYLNPNVKKVLWLYYAGNDFGDLNNELTNIILKNYLNDLSFTQNLKLKQKEINRMANEMMKAEAEKEIDRENSLSLKFIKFIKFIKIYNTRHLITPPPPQQQPELEFEKILKLTNNFLAENNSQLYFVYLPEYSHYKKNYNNSNYLKVKKIVNQLNIPLIDIHKEVFDKEPNPLKLFPFELKGHYTVEGYKKVAEKIYKLSK